MTNRGKNTRGRATVWTEKHDLHSLVVEIYFRNEPKTCAAEPSSRSADYR
jgi:hypothetical protein